MGRSADRARAAPVGLTPEDTRCRGLDFRSVSECSYFPDKAGSPKDIMRSKAFGTILLGFCVCVGLGQAAHEGNHGPVQAELMKHVNVRQLAVGDTVFARVTLDWSSPECDLRTGAILEAKVEQADPRKTHGESKLALSFTKGQCNGTEMKPLDLVLAAVADPPLDWKTLPDSQVRLPINFSNPHGSGMLAGIGSSGAGDMWATHLELAGVLHRFPMKANVKPGDVIDIKGLKLDIGTGPNKSSVLYSKEHDVSLATFSQFLLVPSAVAFQSAKASLSGSGPAPALERASARSAIAEALPANNLDVCAPPGCAVDLPVSAKDLEGHSGGSLAIHSLGYVQRANKSLTGFEDEDALAWFGSQQLLFAFNPHPLIRRGGASGTSRMIRAVLIDAQSHEVLRAMDWEITDARQYLWPLDEHRVLVHVASELRVYSAGLEVERRIPLAGPLAWVRISPNGELIAVATLRERHSADLHAKLREDIGSEPEEDVDVAILDKAFTKIADAATISGLQPPTLLNEGQVKLLAQPKMRYRLAMSTWDNKASTLARFDSMCTPQLSSIAPDLLFLMSCNAKNGDAEYRVLRPDGKMVLRARATPRETGQEAMGNGRTFAVKVVHAEREITPGADFKGTDLESAEVRVYRAQDGKRLLALQVDHPSTSYGDYALSPDGAELAVVSGSEIRFYPVPVE